ncbi:MAG TPA: enoyl-CoA hydratase-related protein [Syntrophomonas sp.]|nr:enoyl-CoA hydratase-related protein [Syntrophomonas sp.]
MELETLFLEIKDPLAVITFKRPETTNAANLQSISDLDIAVSHINSHDQVKAVILWGGPSIFSTGGNIKFMLHADQLEMERYIARCHEVHNKIANSPVPYVAAIAGMALGIGFETALACDFRIATENTVFGLTQINLGIIPGAGGTQRLPRLIGSGWAKHLIMTGDIIDAHTAYKIGLITRITTTEGLFDEAEKVAVSLAFKSPLALRAAKKCVELSENTDLPVGLSYEQKTWAFLFSCEDQSEGMQSFIEKRKPLYKGK